MINIQSLGLFGYSQRLFFLLSLWGCWLISYSPSITAQLPPPPPVRDVSSPPPRVYTPPMRNISTITSPTITPESQDSVNLIEYKFQAPSSIAPAFSPSAPMVSPSNSATKVIAFYRVEVTTNDELVLSEVKKIEPLAFIRKSDGVIYAGLFQEQQSAQKRVQDLTNLGLSARIVPVNYSVSSSYSMPVQR